MSSTDAPGTFAELYTDLLNRARESTSQTSRVTQAKRYINIANQDIALGFGEKLSWLERRATLLTHPVYNTGTVTVSQGSGSVTGSGTAWNSNNAFGQRNIRPLDTPDNPVNGIYGQNPKIVFAGQNEVYVVNTVTSDTALALNSTYVGSDLSGASYKAFEDEYELALDFLKPIDAKQFSDAIQILLVSRTEFRRAFVRNATPGRPKVATIVDQVQKKTSRTTKTGERNIIFHPPPSEAMVIPYSYVTKNLATSTNSVEQYELSADTDLPLMPLRYRHLLVLGGLKNWYRDQQDDSRYREVAAEYGDAVRRMVADVDVGAEPHARIRPRRARYHRNAARPWGGSASGGRRYDVNGAFDRLEDL